MNQLTKLLDKNFSDKGTREGDTHHYSAFYDSIFYPFREQPVNILEFGLARGASAVTWLEYFKAGNVYGVDREINFINQEAKKNERLHLYEMEAEKFAESCTESFDIIIDDADHALSTQISLLQSSWRLLKPNGFYIIEDLLVGKLPWGPLGSPTQRFTRYKYNGHSGAPPRKYLPVHPQDISFMNRTELPEDIKGILEKNSHYFITTNVSENGGLHMIMVIRKDID